MVNKIKRDNGLSGIDIVISIGILTIFSSIIASIYINLHMANIKIERQQIATNYAIQLLEKADELYYGEVTQEKFATYEIENGKHQILNIKISRGYDVNVTVTNCNDIESDMKYDFVKIVKVVVNYKVGSKPEKVELSKIKTKENIKTPNAPRIENNMVPVRYKTKDNEKILETVDKEDSKWYRYESGIWALAVQNKDILENGNIKENPDVFVWIPRFAYYKTASSIDAKFVFANGQRQINSNGDLEKLPENYIIPNEFNVNDIERDGIWININDINTNSAANILNNSVKYKLIN